MTLTEKIEQYLKNPSIKEGIALYEQCPNHNIKRLAKFKKGMLEHLLMDPDYNVFVNILANLKYNRNNITITPTTAKKPPVKLTSNEATSATQKQAINYSYPRNLLTKIEQKGRLANRIAMLNTSLTNIPLANTAENKKKRKPIIDEILVHEKELAKIMGEQRYFEKFGELYEELPEENEKKLQQRKLNNATVSIGKWRKKLTDEQNKPKPNPERIAEAETKIAEWQREKELISTNIAGLNIVIKEKHNERNKR